MDAPHLGYRNDDLLWDRTLRLASSSSSAEVSARVEAPPFHPPTAGLCQDPTILERGTLSYTMSLLLPVEPTTQVLPEIVKKPNGNDDFVIAYVSLPLGGHKSELKR